MENKMWDPERLGERIEENIKTGLKKHTDDQINRMCAVDAENIDITIFDFRIWQLANEEQERRGLKK